MKRDRISDGVYVFTSGLYAEVTATVVFTDEGAMLVDTLPFPQETRHIRDFMAQRRTKVQLRHQYALACRPHLRHLSVPGGRGGGALPVPAADGAPRRDRAGEAKQQTPQLADVKIRYPELLFNEAMTLRVGGKTIELNYSPGHSRDMITVHVVEDRLMVASDTVMPVPLRGRRRPGRHDPVAAGDQGEEPGEPGSGARRGVAARRDRRDPGRQHRVSAARWTAWCASASRAACPATGVLDITIEECGLSRIPLGGLVQKLHQANLLTLYDAYRSEMSAAPSVNGTGSGTCRTSARQNVTF